MVVRQLHSVKPNHGDGRLSGSKRLLRSVLSVMAVFTKKRSDKH